MDLERWRRVERTGGGTILHAPHHTDPQFAGTTVLERDAQRERQHDRKSKHPEQRLGLAIESPNPGERELDQRTVTHRECAGR